MSNDNRFVLLVLAAVVSGCLLIGLALHPLFDRASEQRRQHGYEAGKAGLPVEACPYNGWPDAREWKQGWIQGAMERGACRVD